MKNVQQEISNLVSQYHASMVSKDTNTLNHLIDDNYYLVHITGYVQPKQEWFQVMSSGTFDYHDISIRSLKIDATDEVSDAVVTGDGIFKATIYGMNRPWHLYFKLFMKKQNDHWIILHAEYSS
jgi:hypothetical protein